METRIKTWITIRDARNILVPTKNTVPSFSKIKLSSDDRIVAAEAAKTDRVDEVLTRSKKLFYTALAGRSFLPVSYWVNGFLGRVVAAVAIAIIAASADFKDDFRPALALAAVIAVWAVLFAVTTWQVVGVWRSATKYRYVRLKRFWGGCAKLFVVLGVLQGLAQFASPALHK